MLKIIKNYKYQDVNRISLSGKTMGVFLLYSFSSFSKFTQVEYKCKFIYLYLNINASLLTLKLS